MQTQRIKSIRRIGTQNTIDLEVNHPDHNFYANGIIVSNSHARAYGKITNSTVYLKAKHTKAFFLASLRLAQHETDPLGCITSIRREMEHFKIPLYPPSLKHSQEDHTLEGEGIRMGLCSVKGLSEAGLSKIRLFTSTSYSNKFELFSTLTQSGVSLSVASPMILSGCLSIENESRNKLLMELEIYKELTERELPIVHKFGEQYSYDLATIIKKLSTELLNEKGKPYIKESRVQTLRKKLSSTFERFIQNERHIDLTYWIMEDAFIGFSYSSSLKKIYSEQVDNLLSVNEISMMPTQAAPDAEGVIHEMPNKVRFAAMINEVENKVARSSKKNYVRLTLKDETGMINALLFGEKRLFDILKSNGIAALKEGMVVIINGERKDGSTIFVDTLIVQENPVVVKKSQIKKEEEKL
jgi:DNA polymerase III alpha subunit